MDRFWSVRERRSLIIKLVAGFTVLLLAILLLGISSMLAARDMNWQAAKLYRMELLGISHIKEANIHLISTGRTLRQMVLAPTFVDRDEARAQLDQAMLDLEAEIAAASQSIFRSQEKFLLNEFALEFEHYKRNVDDAIKLIDRSNDYQQKATAYISGEQFNQVGDSAEQLLHRMIAIKEDGARETAIAMARYSRDTQWLTLKLLLGGLLFGAAVTVLIGRAIKQSSEKQSPDRARHAIDNPAQENVDDTLPATDYRNEVVAEERFIPVTAQQPELIQTEATAIVENMPDDMPVVSEQKIDEQSAIISPEYTSGEHCSLECASPEYTSPEYALPEHIWPEDTLHEDTWPEETAKNCAEECARERFESVDEPSIAAIGRASILVVEDNAWSQAARVGLLANTDCKVAIANNGPEALQLLEKSPCDVVLMNMQMMMDGIDLTLEIRKTPAFDTLPIIAMTTSGTHLEWERCLAAGINGHIAKPIDSDELFRALMCWISPGKQYAESRASGELLH